MERYLWRMMMEAWWWLDGFFAWMVMEALLWWLGLVDALEAWLGWCVRGLDDDLVHGGSCIFLFYILPVSWSLPHLRVGSLKPLLVGSKRTLAGSSTKSWSSYFSWNWMICEDWSLPHWHIVSHGFYQYTIEFSIHIGCLSSMWLIYIYDSLMINKCGICFIRTGCKKILGKVRKFGKSILTLIHPPSQCDCCVQ